MPLCRFSLQGLQCWMLTIGMLNLQEDRRSQCSMWNLHETSPISISRSFVSPHRLLLPTGQQYSIWCWGMSTWARSTDIDRCPQVWWRSFQHLDDLTFWFGFSGCRSALVRLELVLWISLAVCRELSEEPLVRAC